MEKSPAYKSQKDTEFGDVSPIVDIVAERSYGRWRISRIIWYRLTLYSQKTWYLSATFSHLDVFLQLGRCNPQARLHLNLRNANILKRSNLSNAKTDGLDTDLHFSGNDYSLLILIFYIPFGIFDLPLNLLTKKFSGGYTLPTCEQTLGHDWLIVLI